MTDWRSQGTCGSVGGDYFFPDRGSYAQVRKARAMCLACPVQQECLGEAMTLPLSMLVGIWGGLSGRELREEWRRQNPNGRSQEQKAS